MRPSLDSRFAARRQASFLAAAVVWAILLLALAPGARGVPSGQPGAHPRIDQDPTGAPYVAGEILVAYEPGTSDEAQKAVVRGSGGRTLEDLPGGVRLVSFPAVADEASQGARERALERKLRGLRGQARVEAADYNYVRQASFTPDDPRFGDQWGLTKARFRGAWDVTRGRRTTRIAIIDSGVSSGHPDIGKIAAQRDFVNGDAVADDHDGHGTHVTGIAAALTDNGRGVSGGCPGCRLLIAKVINSSGDTTDTKIVEGIDWSVDNGADVINLSLGGPADSSVLQSAVNDAASRGAVVVAAAGNERTTVPQYPAAYPSVLAVSATNSKDELAYFSSYGDWVDLAAPGTNILSTLAGGGYGKMSGTSMATPFVSGLAGLLDSEGLSADQIRQRMEATAKDLGPAGDDPYYGYGRIDAAAALQ